MVSTGLDLDLFIVVDATHIQEGWYKPADIWWISYPAACVDRCSDCAIIRRNELTNVADVLVNTTCWECNPLKENKASHHGTEPISVLPFQRLTPFVECLQTKCNHAWYENFLYNNQAFD